MRIINVFSLIIWCRRQASDTSHISFHCWCQPSGHLSYQLKISFLISAVIFLYGDSLFGTEDISGYGAPATGYGGKYLSDFWSTANILFSSWGFIWSPGSFLRSTRAVIRRWDVSVTVSLSNLSISAPAPAYGAPSYAAQRYYVRLSQLNICYL